MCLQRTGGRVAPVPASALEHEVSLQVLPPSYCAVQEAEPHTPSLLPTYLPGDRQFHLLPAYSFRYTWCQPLTAL